MPIIVDGQEYLTTLEAAKLVGLDPETIRRRIRSGQLTGVFAVGGAWAILRHEVERLKQTGRRPRNAPADATAD